MHQAIGLGIFATVVAFYVFIAPFTKVEESFNVQAAHDLLYHGINIKNYDHLEFPGVVPRTFLGAIPLAALTAPFKYIYTAIGLPKTASLITMRLILGGAGIASLARFQSSAATAFGPNVAKWLILLTTIQFHFPFYMTRPLPNTLATVLTTAGLADWISGSHPYRSVTLLALSAIVFRCDSIMLAGLVGLHLLLSKKVGFVPGVGVGILASVASLALTVAVDSWFWQRWLWPEGQVLYFNTILNKSSEWGVSAWHWYFTSALPRALHAAYPLAIFGAVLDRRARPAFLVALGFVVLYSNLGHKELRFLFPVLPLWNLCAAAGIARIIEKRKKSVFYLFILLAVASGLAAGAGTAVLGAAASRVNYPGGAALKELHRIEAQPALDNTNTTLTVHIGVLPAMTGVSRFGEEGAPWRYSKTEGLSYSELQKRGFEYLLSERGEIEGYRVIKAVEGFAGWHHGSVKAAVMVGIKEGRLVLPLRIHTAPAVYIHKREVENI